MKIRPTSKKPSRQATTAPPRGEPLSEGGSSSGFTELERDEV